MIKYILFLLSVILISGITFSQKKYSINALTGKGELELVGEIVKLEKETYQAFRKMRAAALKEAVNIKIVSGYRSFNIQKNIWNRKYDNFISQGLSPQRVVDKIVEYSTLPGTSRHHWGTDIDIIDGSVKIPKSILIERNYHENGIYAKLMRWMDTNSEKFGFYLVYTNKENRKGFKYEPWHYTYKPIATKMLFQFKNIKLDNFYRNTKLKGKVHINSEFLKKYTSENISSINPKLH